MAQLTLDQSNHSMDGGLRVSASLIVYGALGFASLSLLFIFHELRNAPYSEALEPEPVPSDSVRQRLRSAAWE